MAHLVVRCCRQFPTQELAHGSLHDQLHTLRLRPQYGLLMQLAQDIASALEHCHAQRPPVVHRDLSARNVLLGGDGRARLADFGLAAAKRRTFLSSDKVGACKPVSVGMCIVCGCHCHLAIVCW